ncbi:phosphatase PAP2 family protein [Diaphorobacter aerolatus]|uniref:Phosphatase PAP2 family protein n=1 Tax=Diaphorobacter aerolatus TaxID=1288495 RepID=A0A7H0GGZ4_9BURK|nr:phosphatase PAP2 family protein [Diaphorobacter aerolatus]QNP47560.1 phosphatase PAP2 family protein [Diaphorobacter aerolatus]
MLPFDHALFLSLNADPGTPAFVVAAAKWLSLGLPSCLFGTMIGALAFATRPVRRDLLVTIAGIALAAMIAYVIRQHWPSLRPAQLGWGIQWLEHGARAGFPSMHATQAFALAQGLLFAPHVRRMTRGLPVIATAWLCAFGIAWSRVCLGVHTPSDVIGGAATGIVAACLIAAAARQLLRRGPMFNGRGRSSAYSSRPALP